MEDNEKVVTQADKVKEITDQLETGIKELFDSERYKTWLDTMSRFHNYSVNNTILIAMQKPDATLVAGYNQWQRDFGRNVNKGEKAIRILAWNPRKEQVTKDVIDPETKKPVLGEDGQPKKVTETIERAGYRVANVFDVSQTDGKELPTIGGRHELIGEVKDYSEFMKALEAICAVPISYEEIQTGAKGFFSAKQNRIVVKEGMSEVQTVKTLIHEMSHQRMHSMDSDGRFKPKSTKEIEAESVAYTVCKHFGIDTSEYSFGYVAGWSADKDMQQIKTSLQAIRRTASTIIEDITKQLKELELERVDSMSVEEAAQYLAGRLDTFARETDPYDYADRVSNSEAEVDKLAHDLIEGGESLDSMMEFFQSVIDDNALEADDAKMLIGEVEAFRGKFFPAEITAETEIKGELENIESAAAHDEQHAYEVGTDVHRQGVRPSVIEKLHDNQEKIAERDSATKAPVKVQSQDKDNSL